MLTSCATRNSKAPLRRPSATTDGETSMARARRTAHPATPHSGTTLPDSPTDGVDRPQSDKQPKAFVPAASELLTIIGPDGCFKHLAPTFPPPFGYTQEELLEQSFIGFIHAADRPATQAALEKLAQGEPTIGLENRFRCKDGSYRRLAWTALATPEGLLYAVARDITDRLQPEEDRARSLAREQTAGLSRQEEFLSSVCHDLQQPLTVILAQTQMLLRDLANDQTLPPGELARRLAHVFTAATRMRGMTQDLVDASLQQSGRPLALLLARTELVALTRQTVLEQQLVSDLHQFVFEAEAPTIVIAVDENRAHRVLANLLTNAVKYSPEGGPVRVTLKETDSSDGKSAQLMVRDQGVGIPQGDLPHVFDWFHRGSNVVGRFAGTGLGLASARELVELYGGAISVESEEGKGSTFVVRLPLAACAE
jgi:PAS domain S-box-containing protein